MAESGGPQILPQSFKSYTKSLNTRDLACPTWGIASVSYTISTILFNDKVAHSHAYIGNVTQSIVGPPFHPIILPPKELLSLDPAWARCSDFEFVYNLFDPPRALSAVPAVSSAVTLNSPTSELSLVTTSTARPGDTISPNLPINTAKSDTAHPEGLSSSTLIAHSDQKPSADFENTSPSIKSPPSMSATHSLQDPESGITALRPSTTSNHLFTASIGRAGNDLGSSQEIGSLIHSVFGEHASSKDVSSWTEQPSKVISTSITPKPDSSTRPPVLTTDPKTLSPESDPSRPDTIAFRPGGPGADLLGTLSFTDGGKTTTVDSTAFIAAGSTMLAGGSGATVPVLSISRGTSGVFVVSSSSIDAASVINAPAISPSAISGVAFVPDSSGSSVVATMVISGGSAITVSGKPISFGPSGRLVTDSSTTVLPSVYQPVRDSFSLPIVSETTLAFEPSGPSLTGTNVISDGSAIMISGPSVSLGLPGSSMSVLTSVDQPSLASVGESGGSN